MSGWEAFAEVLAHEGGQFFRVDDDAQAAELVRGWVGDDSVFVDPEVEGLSSTTTVPWDAAWGVSRGRCAAAATGSVAVSNAAGAHRQTGVVVTHHVVLISADAIVDSYADLVATVFAGPTPSLVRMVYGPSRSSDIELRKIYGMHGPGSLRVVVVG